MEKHPLVGRRFRLLRDHVDRWEDGTPVILHKASTEGTILGIERVEHYDYATLVVDIEGFQPHSICIRIPDADGVWESNIELLLRGL